MHPITPLRSVRTRHPPHGPSTFSPSLPSPSFRSSSALSKTTSTTLSTTTPRHPSRHTQIREYRLDPSVKAVFLAQPSPMSNLGEFVYKRTYARRRPDGKLESWHDTVERVVNGTFSLQEEHARKRGMRMDHRMMDAEAREMYDRIFNMKFLPPGRGLWAMGSALTEERKLYASLNNCAFVSTENLGASLEAATAPFTFLMDAAMLGVGVGFDCKGAGRVAVVRPVSTLPPRVIVIEDSREGWVDSLKALLDSYFVPLESRARRDLDAPSGGTLTLASPEGYSRENLVAFNLENLRTGRAELSVKPKIVFDYSLVRGAGSPIKGFGGTSSGPKPLMDMHVSIRNVLDNLAAGNGVSLPSLPAISGEMGLLTTRGIVDIMNLIGKCVVSGNVRRTAEIAFGDLNDHEYVALKDYEKNPDRAAYGWTSNNSVFCKVGDDYSTLVPHIARNGEPGIAWLENMRTFGRMNNDGYKEGVDYRASGGNPCLEQTLESYELCCLVETFPYRHNGDLQDFVRTLRSAFLYAKTVTLGEVHWTEAREIMNRNRRVGCSMSGIAQFVSKQGMTEFENWCNVGYTAVQRYDAEFSERFQVPESIKTTSIKPSGTVSLLANATPGMHFPESRYYTRRVRLASNSELVSSMREAGYKIEPAKTDPEGTVVVEIPVDVGTDQIKTLSHVSLWEQVSLAAFLQRHWADNQVSCTVTFDPATEANEILPALNHFQFHLKGISFLPRPREKGKAAYEQMPYEEITKEEYLKTAAGIKPLLFEDEYALDSSLELSPQAKYRNPRTTPLSSVNEATQRARREEEVKALLERAELSIRGPRPDLKLAVAAEDAAAASVSTPTDPTPSANPTKSRYPIPSIDAFYPTSTIPPNTLVERLFTSPRTSHVFPTAKSINREGNARTEFITKVHPRERDFETRNAMIAQMNGARSWRLRHETLNARIARESVGEEAQEISVPFSKLVEKSPSTSGTVIPPITSLVDKWEIPTAYDSFRRMYPRWKRPVGISHGEYRYLPHATWGVPAFRLIRRSMAEIDMCDTALAREVDSRVFPGGDPQFEEDMVARFGKETLETYVQQRRAWWSLDAARKRGEKKLRSINHGLPVESIMDPVELSQFLYSRARVEANVNDSDAVTTVSVEEADAVLGDRMKRNRPYFPDVERIFLSSDEDVNRYRKIESESQILTTTVERATRGEALRPWNKTALLDWKKREEIVRKFPHKLLQPKEAETSSTVRRDDEAKSPRMLTRTQKSETTRRAMEAVTEGINQIQKYYHENLLELAKIYRGDSSNATMVELNRLLEEETARKSDPSLLSRPHKVAATLTIAKLPERLREMAKNLKISRVANVLEKWGGVLGLKSPSSPEEDLLERVGESLWEAERAVMESINESALSVPSPFISRHATEEESIRFAKDVKEANALVRPAGRELISPSVLKAASEWHFRMKTSGYPPPSRLPNDESRVAFSTPATDSMREVVREYTEDWKAFKAAISRNNPNPFLESGEGEEGVRRVMGRVIRFFEQYGPSLESAKRERMERIVAESFVDMTPTRAERREFPTDTMPEVARLYYDFSETRSRLGWSEALFSTRDSISSRVHAERDDEEKDVEASGGAGVILPRSPDDFCDSPACEMTPEEQALIDKAEKDSEEKLAILNGGPSPRVEEDRPSTTVPWKAAMKYVSPEKRGEEKSSAVLSLAVVTTFPPLALTPPIVPLALYPSVPPLVLVSEQPRDVDIFGKLQRMKEEARVSISPKEEVIPIPLSTVEEASSSEQVETTPLVEEKVEERLPSQAPPVPLSSWAKMKLRVKSFLSSFFSPSVPTNSSSSEDAATSTDTSIPDSREDSAPRVTDVEPRNETVDFTPSAPLPPSKEEVVGGVSANAASPKSKSKSKPKPAEGTKTTKKTKKTSPDSDSPTVEATPPKKSSAKSASESSSASSETPKRKPSTSASSSSTKKEKDKESKGKSSAKAKGKGATKATGEALPARAEAPPPDVRDDEMAELSLEDFLSSNFDEGEAPPKKRKSEGSSFQQPMM